MLIKHKKIFLIAIVTAMTFLVLLAYAFYHVFLRIPGFASSDSNKYQSIEYSSLQIVNFNGSKIKFSSIESKYKILFNIPHSDTEELDEALGTIKGIMDLVGSTDFKFALVWEKPISQRLLKKYGIDISINYTANDKNFKNVGDLVVLLDEKNNVLYDSFHDYSQILTAVKELNVIDLNVRILKMVKEDLAQKGMSFDDKKKYTLLILTDPSCKECKEFISQIENGYTIFNDKFNCIFLFPYGYMGSSPNWNTVEQPIGSLYSVVFDTTAPTSFILLDDKFQIIKKDPSLRDLVEYTEPLITQ